MKLTTCLLAGLASLCCVAPARAHYLFIRITPFAEAGRACEVYFSERAVAGDPRFIAKVAPTRLWIETTPGDFQPLAASQGSDRLRAHLPPTGGVVVVGQLDYGVLARPGQVPFLLRHYPKAVDGTAAELNPRRPRPEAILEITAQFDGDQVQFTAWLDGKPMAGAVLHTIDEDLVNEELTTDDQGAATWSPGAAGNYSVYVEHVRKESGQQGDKAYSEIREFATLNFNWPLERSQADAGAVELFEEALAARAQWREFQGFTANLSGVMDGRPYKGHATVDGAGSVTLETDEETVRDWVRDQLGSLVMHRRARDQSSASRPAPTLWFADRDEQHPLGRLLTFSGGDFAASYRIKDRQIMTVNRHLGPQEMTITMQENEVNSEGLFLPHDYTVQYWNSEDGTLQRTEVIQDRWQRVGAWDLPVEHRVTSASDQGLSVRTILLSGHSLAK